MIQWDSLNALLRRLIGFLRRAGDLRSPGANPDNPPLPVLKPWLYSVTGHALLLAFMLIGFSGRTQPEVPIFGTIAIDGVVLDDEAVKREIQRLDEQERAAVAEREQEVERLRQQIEEQEAHSRRRQQELSALDSQAEEARRALDAQQDQASRQLDELEQRRQQERERLERIERERLAEEERARAAEQERRKTEEETRELTRQAEQARRRLEEVERKEREAAMAEELRRELEAEKEAEQRKMEAERRRRAVESGLLDEYKTRIRQRIESNWTRPLATSENLEWVVVLDVLPGNEIDGIRFEKFNGTAADRDSLERAILRSSPLPAPPEPELFAPELRLRYPPPAPGGPVE